jgi:hypothetical protein
VISISKKIGTKFPPLLTVTNFYQRICGTHKVGFFPFQLNFLDTHESEIEHLIICLRGQKILPLEPIYC